MKIKLNHRCILCALMLTTSFVTVNLPITFAESNPQVGNEAQAPAANELIGKPVTSVIIQGVNSEDSVGLMELLNTKVGDSLTEEAVKNDMKALYDTGNFIDVSTDFVRVPEGVKVVYTAMENPILDRVVITGNVKFDESKILSFIKVEPGKTLNTKTLNENIRELEQAYREEGYIFSKVSNVDMSKDGVLTLSINEGILEGFAVKGNEKTKDYVITREMRLKPGEPFNAKDARRSMQRVYNLGFFDDVNMKINPGVEPNAVVLETDVVERRTGTFAIGGGYSQSDGLIGIIEVGDTNFRGTGDNAKIHWEFGGDADSYDNYEFSYTRPWIDKKETSAGIRIYDMTKEFDDYDNGGERVATYDKNYKGIDLFFSRPMSEYSTNSVTLRYRDDAYVEWVDGRHYDDATLYPNYLDDNFGNTRSIILGHVTDTRDNVYNPTDGARASLQAEFAGWLGGDFDYNKYTFEDRHYFKVGRNHVIATRGTIGLADGSMPESALFSVGGQSTLRGYEDRQFEGKYMLLGSVEYRFPVVNKIQAAVFTDFGGAWENKYDFSDMHASVGVGIQVETPIGPIRLDYGRGEDGGKTHFTFGGNF
ncbi:BamA/OMP85 family outer membrane protein [Anaerosinus sp.]|uniref:BamA/OMP85 family outer membrane protein n=1 Tax=Selenobaculum sp. TaxID=3074374 RepID=UPI0015B0EB9A